MPGESRLDQKNAYDERFPVGTTVKIKEREYLQDFLKSWHLHNPLCPEQVSRGGQLDVVKLASITAETYFTN